MAGRRKTDFDPVHMDESIDWDIKVDRDTGYDGMEGRVTSVRRRYFTVTLRHVLMILVAVAAGMVGGALGVGFLFGISV